MFQINARGNIISVQNTELITSGSVAVYKCHFVFDSAWDGFFKSAVFRVGSMSRTEPLDSEDTCEIPWELLVKKNVGLSVEVSVYGTKGEVEILPTIWDKLGRIRAGSEPGDDAKDPTPSTFDRIATLVKSYGEKVADELEDAKAAADDAKEFAEEAEEWAKKAAVGGSNITADMVTFSDGDTFQQKYNSGELRGPAGPAGKDGKVGKDGAPGYTPVKGIDYFDGAPGAAGKDGDPGKDGVDGYTPVKGVDYFDGQDGQDGYTPVKGVDYFDGKDGADGQNGITPHIGDNKNWFIGDTDTGVRAEGKDGQGGSGGSSNVYSTEETVVGTWIDGKPIYRIVMLGTTPSAINTIQTVTGSWSNLESLVDVKGYIDGSVSYSTIRRPITDTSTFVVWLTRTSLNMKVVAADYIGRPFYLVVEYTKTTDTATIAIPTAAALMAAYEEGVQNA